jgi:hypothetical protein
MTALKRWVAKVEVILAEETQLDDFKLMIEESIKSAGGVVEAIVYDIAPDDVQLSEPWRD